MNMRELKEIARYWLVSQYGGRALKLGRNSFCSNITQKKNIIGKPMKFYTRNWLSFSFATLSFVSNQGFLYNLNDVDWDRVSSFETKDSQNLISQSSGWMTDGRAGGGPEQKERKEERKEERKKGRGTAQRERKKRVKTKWVYIYRPRPFRLNDTVGQSVRVPVRMSANWRDRTLKIAMLHRAYRVINPNCSNVSSHCSWTTKNRKLGIVFDERVFTDICFLRKKFSKHAQ